MPDSLPTLRTERLALRPVAEEDLDELLAIVSGPSVREWWGRADRDDLRNDGRAFTIEVGDAVAGWLGFEEENEPDYRYAGLDISLAPGFQDQGLGPEALLTIIEWLVTERGHRRFTIDPAAHNERAIAAYEKVGFRRVGVMRGYERGPDGAWHDNLLMDLLAEDLDASR
jgi:aminoglycoside 6'-N-acetyltransferase